MANRDKKHSQTSAAPAQIDKGESSPKRHVYVEPGVTIDFTDDLKKAQGNEQNKQLKLAVITTVLLFLTAAFAGWQGWSSRVSAEAAKNAADIARKTLDASNRSWVEPVLAPPWHEEAAPTNPKVFADQHYDLEVQYTLTNIGRVPITNVKVDTAIEVLDRLESPHFAYAQPHWGETASILYPSRQLGAPAIWLQRTANGGNVHHEVTEDLKRQFDTGEKYFVAYGEGSFDDPLGAHWFRFCSWILLSDAKYGLPSVQARDCADYNSTGDGIEPH
jgi:hypothetical protein